ncbi:MAG: RDD family protein [Bacteroidota bacterium]|nr:RDD family protein [Bacteroidota bacterium]
MENISIGTIQNVTLEHSVASIGERILAHLIDYLLFAGYGTIILVLHLLKVLQTKGLWGTFIVILPLLLYDLVCELKFNGQNVGKRLMKLRVVKQDGSQPDAISYFIRWIFRLVDNLFLFGGISTLTIIINGQGQRLGDIAAGTTVVRQGRQQSLDSLFHHHLPENYAPVFPTYDLSENDYKIIEDILKFRQKNGQSYSVQNTMKNAREKFEKKLNVNSALRDYEFLTTLRNDYIYNNKEK